VSSRDWAAWHRDNDRPGSHLEVRLGFVQRRIRDWLAGARDGPLRALSLCGGEGRDLLGALAAHRRAEDVAARIVELDPRNVAAARAHFAEAGLEALVDLREGDLRETLKEIEAPVDFVLMDVWTEMVRPALELVAPRLRAGAVVVCDNTRQFREAYRDYFDFVNDPARGFKTATLPFEGGLEFTVKL
jgi:hypothetical protein